jgi:cytochrome c oxidase cbb3-type subunit III
MKNIFFKKIQTTLTFWLITGVIYAQNANAAETAKTQALNNVFLWVYLGVIGVLAITTAFLALRTLKLYQGLLLKAIAKEQGRELTELEDSVQSMAKDSWVSKLWYELVGTGGQTIEENKDIQINHPHDGIYELDNGMPPWLRNVFAVTIAFAFAYIWYYHFYSEGKKGQMYEYKLAMQEGEKQKLEAEARQANSVSETSVVALKDETSLNAGKTIFIEKCVACHGQKGEGGVGPNMTDDYWLHGGDAKAIFKVIKYGVPDKGMISWKEQLNPKAMQDVTSYILTLKGTNPPNAKAPQGEIYKGDAVPAADTAKSKI